MFFDSIRRQRAIARGESKVIEQKDKRD